jgi:hypothetical protein
MTEVMIVSGIFLGCLMRALFPFLKKQKEATEAGKPIKWESRYIWTLIFGVAVSVIATMFILPSFAIPVEYIFPTAFLEGWAAQDILNKIAT